MVATRSHNALSSVSFGRVTKASLAAEKNKTARTVALKSQPVIPKPLHCPQSISRDVTSFSQVSEASTCIDSLAEASLPEPSSPTPQKRHAGTASHSPAPEPTCPSAAAVLSVCHECEPTPGVRTKECTALKDALTREGPASLYVCGSPGAGKSMTVARVLRDLVTGGAVAASTWVHCAGLAQPTRMFDDVATQLGISPGGNAAEAIANFAVSGSRSSRERFVVVLEEIDFLPTKLLYTVFEWPALAGSCLSVIGVSNAIDLPVKSLPWLRATNRMPTVLPFKPYTAVDLAKIVTARLDRAGLAAKDMLSPPAVALASRKVAAVSGDARLVLDVCREAVLMCESSSSLALSPIIAVSQVLARRGRGSVVIDTVRALPMHQKLVLCVVACAERRLSEHKSSNHAALAVKTMSLGALHESFKSMCRKGNIPSIGFADFADVCCDSLSGNHDLLSITEKRKGRKRVLGAMTSEPRNRIARLKAISVHDVEESVSDVPVLSLIMNGGA